MIEEQKTKKLRGSDFSPEELKRILAEDAVFVPLLNETERAQFELYAQELIETNKYLNLTALTKAEDIAYLHFYDSLGLLPVFDELGFFKDSVTTFMDVGSGAGFPGIPVKIMRPNWELVLIDALAKRVRFLNQVASKLQLNNLQAIHARAEEAAHQSTLREQADLVSARAVASLNILLEYCLPLVKVGGYFVAMKAEMEDELTEALPMIKRLGGELCEVKHFVLPKIERKRSFVIVKKQHSSPVKYPRSNSQIKHRL